MNIKALLTALLVVFFLTCKSQEYVITSYGAVADSTRLSTGSIQSAIDAAHLKGGGTVIIPKGVFLSGAVFFKPNTKLKLLKGAVLKGSDDINQYPLVSSRMEGQSLDYYAALVNAYQVNGFSVTGPGAIDGNGLKFWKTFWAHRDSLRKIGKESTNLEVHRPRLLFIWGSNNVSIKDVFLRNSGFWTTHLYQCNDVLIENCDIRSPFKPVPAPSTDGVDIDVCKRVTIRNCYISVNDDAIAIKGGKGPNARELPENGAVEDILIENCTFGNAHATLTIGSESIYARNITMRNCKVNNNCPVFNIKMRPDTYQVFENITISGITGKCGSIINVNAWKQFFDLGESSDRPFGIVRNIILSDITVTCEKLGTITGNPRDQISGFTFRNISATAKSPALKNNYEGMTAENFMVNEKAFTFGK